MQNTMTATEIDFYPTKRDPARPLDPAPLLAARRAQDGIRQVEIWNGDRPWLVTRYDDYRAVEADERVSAEASRPGFPFFTEGQAYASTTRPTFLEMDEPEHGRFRKMLTSDFSVKKMEALRPQIRSLVNSLIDGFVDGPQPFDLVEGFTKPFTSMVICMLMGVDYSFHKEFQHFAELSMDQSTPAQKLIEADERFHGFVRAFIEEKKEKPDDRLMSSLVHQRLLTGAITEDELIAIFDLIFVAGHETTANQIGLGIIALLDHPGEADFLRETDDPQEIRNASEELLRYLTIVHFGRRRALKEDLEINGQLIRAGEGIIADTGSANRDESIFPEADRLDLRRDTRGHVTFGWGPHQCLGQNLARVELQEAYSALLRRLPGLRIAAPVSYAEEAIVYGPAHLPLAWDA